LTLVNRRHQIVIAETDNVLSPSTGGFFANYMKDAVSVVKQYDYLVKCREIQLPAVGTAGGFGGKKRQNIILSFTNYTTPGTIYSLILVGKSAVYEKPKDFKSDDYESKQVFYTSKDGTKI
jgi:prolyl oligopeptidase